jgi:hypothetical protein
MLYSLFLNLYESKLFIHVLFLCFVVSFVLSFIVYFIFSMYIVVKEEVDGPTASAFGVRLRKLSNVLKDQS